MGRSDGHPYMCNCSAGNGFGGCPGEGLDHLAHAKAGLVSGRTELVSQYEAACSSPSSGARLLAAVASLTAGRCRARGSGQDAWQTGEAAGRGPRRLDHKAPALGRRSAGRLPVNTAQLGPSRHYQWHLGDRACPKGPCGLGGTGPWPASSSPSSGPAAVSPADARAPGPTPRLTAGHAVDADQHRHREAPPTAKNT